MQCPECKSTHNRKNRRRRGKQHHICVICNKAVYLALGVNLEGNKELLGMWMSQAEAAKFWLGILTELKNRGLQDIFIACVDIST